MITVAEYIGYWQPEVLKEFLKIVIVKNENLKRLMEERPKGGKGGMLEWEKNI